MEQQLQERKCVGWQESETVRLFSAVQQAQQQGAPLRQVFETLSGDLNRKPNSIRNYYYACLRQQPESTPRVQSFVPFSAQEAHDLLRQVLIGRGEGKSVRACVMQLAQGDHGRMLRYQNKYRALIKHQPQLVRQVCQELQQEGLPCPADATESAAPAAAPAPASTPQGYLHQILQGVQGLMHCAAQAENAQKHQHTIDRMRVEQDLRRIAWEKDYEDAIDHLRRLTDCLHALESAHFAFSHDEDICMARDALSAAEEFLSERAEKA